MTLTRPGTGVARVTSVQVQELTGELPAVLYTVGWARNAGVLVRVESQVDHGDGTVTARIHHTHPFPLKLPTGLSPVSGRRARREGMDYLPILLWVGGAGVVSAIAWVVVGAVRSATEWVGAHQVQVSAGGLLVLLLLGAVAWLLARGRGGGGCTGLHCGGCRG